MSYQQLVVQSGARLYLPMNGGPDTIKGILPILIGNPASTPGRLDEAWPGGQGGYLLPPQSDTQYTIEAWVRSSNPVIAGEKTYNHDFTVLNDGEMTQYGGLKDAEPHMNHWVSRRFNEKVGVKKQANSWDCYLIVNTIPNLAGVSRTYKTTFDYNDTQTQGNEPHPGIVIGYLDDNQVDAVYIQRDSKRIVWWNKRPSQTQTLALTDNNAFSANLYDGKQHTLEITLDASNTVTDVKVDGESIRLNSTVCSTPFGNRTGLFQHDYNEGRGGFYNFSATEQPSYERVIINEDFEGRGTLEWTNPEWQAQSSYKKSGSQALRSPVIPHSSQTKTAVSVDCLSANSLSFDYYVESETNYDKFFFSVDGNVLLTKSGNTGWQSFTTTLSAGQHKLEFSYTTDNSTQIGISGVVLDNLKLTEKYSAGLLGSLNPVGKNSWKVKDAAWQGPDWTLEDNWHHIALVSTGSEATLYLDGQSLGTRPVSLGPLSYFPVGLGYEVAVDEVSYTPLALSSAVINEHANASEDAALPIGPPRWFGLPQPASSQELNLYLRKALAGESRILGLPEGWSVLAGGRRYTRDTTGAVSIPAEYLPLPLGYVLDETRKIVAATGPLFDRVQYGLGEEGELTESEVDGYGYYGNYGSGFYGGTLDIEFEGPDSVFTDETWEVRRGKEFIYRENVTLDYGRVSRFGEILKESSDEIYAYDNSLPRGGRFFKNDSDDLYLKESLRQSGIRAYKQSDTILYDDNRQPSKVGLVAKLGKDLIQIFESPSNKPSGFSGHDFTQLTEKYYLSGQTYKPQTEEFFVFDKYVMNGGINSKFASDDVFLVEYRQTQLTRWSPSALDEIALTEKYTQGGLRELEVQSDTFTDSPTAYLNGRILKSASDTAFSVEERHLELHGKLYPNGGTDNITVLSDTYSLHGRRALVYRDTFLLRDTWVDPTPDSDDEITVEDSGIQSGIRVFYVADKITLNEAKQNDHVYFREDVTLLENQIFPYAYPLLRESFELQESGSVFGFIRDEASLSDSRYNLSVKKNAVRRDDILNEVSGEIHGRVNRKFSDAFTLRDRWIPFRLDWKDQISLAEHGEVEEQFYQPIRLDTVSLQEQESLHGFLVDITDYEEVELVDKPNLLRAGHTDKIQLLDSAARGGIWSIVVTENIRAGDTYLRPQNYTPHFQDDIPLNDVALQLHGKLQWTSSDTTQLEDTPLQLHGRRSFKYTEFIQVQETRNTPGIAIQTETITLIDSRHSLPSQVDWFVMRESGIKEDGSQVIRLIDTGILNTIYQKLQERLSLVETFQVNSSLDQRVTVRLQENRLLLKDVRQSDNCEVRDSGKLFRKSDYLEPNPIFYDERPGRTRTALRLVNDPEGNTWAVWLDGKNVNYTKRLYEDSWRNHVVTSVPLPFEDARSCTLVFIEDRPCPVVESHQLLHAYTANSWQTKPGVDPVTCGDELAYLTSDRMILVRGSDRTQLSGRSRLDQSFKPNGILVYNDLDEVAFEISSIPDRAPEPNEEIASARWRVPQRFIDPVSYLAPIEGNLTND